MWRTIGNITLIVVLLFTALIGPELNTRPPSAGLALGPAVVEAQEPPPPAPLWGIADTHNHQFANLGFGGLMIWGDVFRWDDDIAKALPWSDAMPARFGDVVNNDGSPILPTVVFGTPGYPNVPATCPPGGNGAFGWCWGVPIHGAGGLGDLLNIFLSGGLGHLVGGYPQFDGWPRWNIYTAQQMYYKWLERAWRDGGLRLMVMLAVNNEAICGRLKQKAGFGCDDMPAIDRQIQAAKGLEMFIDNQYGGPGQGWYRIAYSPAQARQIIADGKLAVVLGIETPSLFGCKIGAGCTEEYVLTELQRYRDMGVRHIYPLHNADNAFGGTGLYNQIFAFNNKIINGEWFDVTNDCDPGIDFHLDWLDALAFDPIDFLTGLPLYAKLLLLAAAGADSFPPRPPAGPNCNARDLQPLGETLIEGMIDLKMIIDVDHLSSRTFADVMDIAERRQYPGIVASHTSFVELGNPRGDADSIRYEANKTPDQIERIRALGGLIGVIIHQGDRSQMHTYLRPDNTVTVSYRCGSSSEAWAQHYLYAVDHMQGGAVAFASDMNGLAGVPTPRFGPERCHDDIDAGYNPTNPVVYSNDPNQGLTQMRVGDKLFNYNYDGFANIGLLPDFIQDVRNIGVGDADLAPLFSSAEAYVRMWEQVGDIPPEPTNGAPSAHAGGPYLALAGTTVTLHGTGSDPDGDALSYVWDLNGDDVFETSGQNVSFSASGSTRDVPAVLRTCDTRAACTSSRTFVHIRTPGRVVAWGSNENGQLGVPPSAVGTCGSYPPCSPAPIPVPGLQDVVDISAGGRQSLALTSDGRVWQWGVTKGSTPTLVTGLQDVASIAAGYDHVLALKNDGSVWAWGDNWWGQLGTGDWDDRADPVQVAGVGPVVAIAAGDKYSLALLDDGSVWGWGYNHYYELGDQCYFSGSIFPQECASPVRVPDFGGRDTVGISAGATWSLALDKYGSVLLQGGFDPNSNLEPRLTPERMNGLGNSAVVSAGNTDHILSRRPDGTVWAYGSNSDGQLGSGCTESSRRCFTPVQVTELPDARTVLAANGYSLALDEDGSIWGWGNNSVGQLGDGASGQFNNPVPVKALGITGATAVAAGGSHSLALVPAAPAPPPGSVSVTAQPGEATSVALPHERGWLDLPAGVVTVPTTFTYTELAGPSEAPTPGALQFAGLSFTLEARDGAGNPVTSFPVPFTLVLNYQDTDWQDAGIPEEHLLNLFWWDPATAQWRGVLPCDGCSLDVVNNRLTAQLGHLTEFALLGWTDNTPPAITASAAPAANAAGWNNTDVIVTLNAVDNAGGSGVQSVTYAATEAQTMASITVNGNSAAIVIAAEGRTTLTYAARDNAGNVSAWTTVMIQVDKTAPTASGIASPAPNAAGWNNSDVTVSFSGADGLSGVAACDADVVLSSEGAGQSASGTCTDLAGNVSAPAVASAINIDRTPPILSITTPQPYAVLPVGTALDFGASDTLSELAGAVAATLANGATTQPVSSGDAVTQAGVYTLVVQATDQAGNQASEARYFVVYDPSGGFVTGGGWIDSPAGAYVADPTLAGKATFGFVSRYQKGATVPTGNTEFQFRAGNLDFHSSSYEWLVINQSGTNAQFRGSGTINGAGSYKFMLWAGDGSPDSFRIKIWEEPNGVESVVYDNGVQQPIGGGSIVVHKK